MKTNTKIAIIVSVLLTTSFLIMFEQYLTCGQWWTWDQVLHHEDLALVISAIGIGITSGFFIKSKASKRCSCN